MNGLSKVIYVHALDVRRILKNRKIEYAAE